MTDDPAVRHGGGAVVESATASAVAGCAGPPEVTLIGRESEVAALEGALLRLRAGVGGLVLVRGEAGAGKTRLVKEVLHRNGGMLVLNGFCRPGVLATPYLPFVQVLRAGRATGRSALRYGDPPGSHLSLLLPELGPRPEASDQEMIVEAVGTALRDLARAGPCVAFLDDLHWADHQTLELMVGLARGLAQDGVLMIGAYRDEQLPRGHGLRLARAELRRGGRLHELRLGPLDREQTAALAAGILGMPPPERLADAIHSRAEGLPFFVEELARALATRGAMTGDSFSDPLPLPETISDAVLAQAALLSGPAREALAYAAAMGLDLELDVLCDVVAPSAVEELASTGFVVSSGREQARFRHALVREAVYGDIPLRLRRERHRRLAERFTAGRSHPPERVAEQWLLAGEPDRARPYLLTAAEDHCRLHAYREAALALETALQTWREDEDAGRRAETLERLARCAELAGDTDAAIATLAAAMAGHRSAADRGRLQRALAGLHEIRGDWDLAIAARNEAAAAFEASTLHADAASERLAAASHLQSAERLDAALRAVEAAGRCLERAPRLELRARALALEGQIRAKLGQGALGVERAREGLSLALALADDFNAAADAYYRLADALEHAPDYGRALRAYETAVDYCRTRGMSEDSQVCFACLAPTLRQIGEWDRAIEVCRAVEASRESPLVARMVAAGELGLIHAARGTRRGTRGRLTEAFAFAREAELFGLEVDSAHGLARLDDLEDRPDRAADRLRELLERCGERQEAHYSVSALRWAATFFSSRGARADVGACAEALSRFAQSTGTSEATAAVAHALAEVATLDEDLGGAAAHFERALAALASHTVPLDTAEIGFRAGTTLARAGERQRAVERLVTAYRTAKKLRMPLLAAATVSELAALGERVERRLGRRGHDDLAQAGLSRRELEVMRLVAQGRTNREIAGQLFLSPRTVDTHVRNLLRKLDCRSKTEAARRATELGVL